MAGQGETFGGSLPVFQERATCSPSFSAALGPGTLHFLPVESTIHMSMIPESIYGKYPLISWILWCESNPYGRFSVPADSIFIRPFLSPFFLASQDRTVIFVHFTVFVASSKRKH